METPLKTASKRVIRITKDLFEKSHWEQNLHVVGIDEVGRGCLAGPVVTAAAILPIGKTSRLLKDSKLLDEQERLKAFAWITKHCWYQTAIINHRLIDEHNIYQATMLAMKKALVNLLAQVPFEPGAVLVDAMPLKLADAGFGQIPLYHFTQGERKSSSIAAASIVAKVTRDRLMQEYSTLFPGYHLELHKGYATPTHRNAITKSGHSIIHRTTFLGAFLDTKEQDEAAQQTIC